MPQENRNIEGDGESQPASWAAIKTVSNNLRNLCSNQLLKVFFSVESYHMTKKMFLVTINTRSRKQHLDSSLTYCTGLAKHDNGDRATDDNSQ